eukprot:13102972-Heterocapsa_arctica.AAC.1
MNAKRARRKTNKAKINSEIRVFGDLVTADYLVSKDDVSAGIDKGNYGMVILDHATTWAETPCTCNAKAAEAAVALESFEGARQTIK